MVSVKKTTLKKTKKNNYFFTSLCILKYSSSLKGLPKKIHPNQGTTSRDIDVVESTKILASGNPNLGGTDHLAKLRNAAQF